MLYRGTGDYEQAESGRPQNAVVRAHRLLGTSSRRYAGDVAPTVTGGHVGQVDSAIAPASLHADRVEKQVASHLPFSYCFFLDTSHIWHCD
jgi:hypothetical protein